VTQQPGLANIWLGMNVEKAPFDNIKVRQAIRLALDVDQLLLAGYNGKAPRANALVMPQVLGHWADAPVYKRDVAAAKKLLAEAGHPNGFRTRITVLNQPAFQTMALVARALLQEVGITVDVDAQDGGSFWSAGKGEGAKNLDMLHPALQRQARPELSGAVVRHRPDRHLELAALEKPAVRRAARPVLGRARPEKARRPHAAGAEADGRVRRLVWLTYDVNFFASRAG
jgi:peptide/nickel transport system substrate-binding protein